MSQTSNANLKSWVSPMGAPILERKPTVTERYMPCSAHALGEHGHMCALGRFMMHREQTRKSEQKTQLAPVVNKKALMDELDTPKVPTVPEKK